MAEKEPLKILEQGAEVWNRWRKENDIRVVDLSEVNCAGLDLSGVNFAAANLARSSFHKAILAEASLSGADLSKADLSEANLGGADLSGANLNEAKVSNADLDYADLRGAELQKANLYGTHGLYADIWGGNFREAQLVHADFSYVNSREPGQSSSYLQIINSRAGIDFSGANLYGAIFNEADLHGASFLSANLTGAHLSSTNLSGAILRGTVLHRATLLRADMTNSDLRGAILVEVDLRGATLTGSRVFGISAWKSRLENAIQKNLIITEDHEAQVTVDDIEVAQFIYLLLNNQKIHDVINTITSKAVLILGRFTPERKVILDAIKAKLREMNFLPIIFDFKRATARDFTETIKILAGMSLFVIADITNPKSAPLELQATVPDYQIPFVPIIQEGEKPFSMFNDLQVKYNWVLEPVDYPSVDALLLIFEPAILDRAWEKHRELQKAKTQETQVLSWKTFVNNSGVQS